MKHKHLFVFGSTALAIWVLGTCFFIYAAPTAFFNTARQAVVRQGFGMVPGGIPVNTVYTFPALASPTLSKNPFILTGNRDTLYTTGALDLSNRPLGLHVPDMGGRYYQIELADPRVDVFGSISKAGGGDYLITGPRWHGTVPAGLTQIASPSNSVLFLTRVLVEGDADVPAVYRLSKQIQLRPLGQQLTPG